MTYKLNSLTLLDIAKIGLWLDDPYGDGIRLERIREPGPARMAALDLVYHKQNDLFGEQLIRNEYEGKVRALFNKKGRLGKTIESNIDRAYR